MRSPADMDIIVIDITNRCFLACSNCTRLIAHQTKTRELSPDQLRAALESLRHWYKPGRVVGLIGGEPTMHSQFAEMCRVFRETWRPGHDCTHGREPITDFNQFAMQRLYDRSNGRGLWTSFGPRFMNHYETIMDTFSHWNPNDHTAGGVHQTGLVDAREMCAALGIPWEEFPTYRDNCWVQNKWSASITPAGAYFCEYAGQLDLLYNEGRLAWPIDGNWWKRTPAQFGAQLSICERCSLCLPGPSQVDAKDRDIIGEGHRVSLELVGSPAVKGGRFDAFNPALHTERRTIEAKDNYTNGPRVSDDNPHVKPKSLVGVVVCVGRSAQLYHTMPHNAAIVDTLVVVTTPDDIDTNLVFEQVAPSNVILVETDAVHRFDAAFNKGAMLNAALDEIAVDPAREIAVDPARWIIFTDADVFLHPSTHDFAMTRALNPGVLYGTTRYDIAAEDAPAFASHRQVTDRWPSVVGPNAEPNGYFQLFNPFASSFPERISESFCSAGGVDSWFLQQWPASKRVQIPELSVTHIAHASHAGSDWNGKAPGWRQCGMLTANGFIQTEKPPPGVIALKCTDTLRGRSFVVPQFSGVIPPGFIKPNGRGGLIFGDDDIGMHHIHVAYWCPPAPRDTLAASPGESECTGKAR